MRDFFAQQDRGFRKSAKLFGLLSTAIGGTIILTGLAVTYVIAVAVELAGYHVSDFELQFAELYAAVCLAIGLMIAASCWWKMQQLKAGGKVIAEDLGGHRLETPHLNSAEKRALNIVQEMAVAASIPAPEVYILEQAGINAFAAGFTVHDAIVGLTRGSIERLNRDQLQGVVAHEFAHILNGDMRINLRLVGGLHGILSVMLLAEGMMRTAAELFQEDDPQHMAGNFGMAVALFVLAIFMWPVGLIGTFFGMLVMSATSRTREYMADAMAVQLTRNPRGIADALKVIKGHRSGSRVRAQYCLEASHFFFAKGYQSAASLLASHPPLEQRIIRLDPEWDGVPIFEEDDHLDEYDGAFRNTFSMMSSGTAAAVSALAGGVTLANQAGRQAPAVSSTRSSAMGSTGVDEDPSEAERLDESPFAPNDWTKRYARQILDELPDTWIELVRDPQGCQAMLTCLWMTHATPIGRARRQVADTLRAAVDSLLPHVQKLQPAHQTLLLDLALETVGQVNPGQRQRLQQSLDQLRRLAPEDSLTIWSWSRLLQQRLSPGNSPTPKYGDLAELQSACEVLLSWFCHNGAESDAMAAFAFQRAIVNLNLPNPEIRDAAELTVEMLDVALEVLAESSARCRRQLVIAIGCAVGADHVVELDESNLVRGTFAALGLHVPALLPGQAVAP